MAADPPASWPRGQHVSSRRISFSVVLAGSGCAAKVMMPDAFTFATPFSQTRIACRDAAVVESSSQSGYEAGPDSALRQACNGTAEQTSRRHSRYPRQARLCRDRGDRLGLQCHTPDRAARSAGPRRPRPAAPPSWRSERQSLHGEHRLRLARRRDGRREGRDGAGRRRAGDARHLAVHDARHDDGRARQGDR